MDLLFRVSIVVAILAILGFVYFFIMFIKERKKNEKTKQIGSLRVAYSDPGEPPYVFLELESEEIFKKNGLNKAVLDVKYVDSQE